MILNQLTPTTVPSDNGDDAIDLSHVRAVIFAGGLGTRLRPYTTIIPKPLVPVGERPIIQHIVERLHTAGVTQVDLCVNYLGGLIQTYLSQAKLPDGLQLRWHWEDEPTGTAGALNSVPDLDDTFIAMNGDVLTGLDYRDLVDFHRASGAALTIATHSKSIDIDLGVIDAKDDYVIAFHEKPRLDYCVNMGIYVYEPHLLKYVTQGRCDFSELIQTLLRAGEKVAMYRCDAPWYDIGTPQEYERAVSDVALVAGDR
jgi:NDP-sugar pyrophosphorylase family protein